MYVPEDPPSLYFILKLIHVFLTNIYLPIATPRIVRLHVRFIDCLPFIIVSFLEAFHTFKRIVSVHSDEKVVREFWLVLQFEHARGARVLDVPIVLALSECEVQPLLYAPLDLYIDVVRDGELASIRATVGNLYV